MRCESSANLHQSGNENERSKKGKKRKNNLSSENGQIVRRINTNIFFMLVEVEN